METPSSGAFCRFVAGAILITEFVTWGMVIAGALVGANMFIENRQSGETIHYPVFSFYKNPVN